MVSAKLTMYIGSCFITLAVFRVLGILELEKPLIISLSISAVIFTIADYLEFKDHLKYDRDINQSQKPTIDREYYDELNKFITEEKFRNKWYVQTLYYLSVFSIIVLPQSHLFKVLSNSVLDRISDFTLLLGLGIVLSLIGQKSSYRQWDIIQKLMKLASLYHNSMWDLHDSTKEDLKNINNQVKDLQLKINEIKEPNEMDDVTTSKDVYTKVPATEPAEVNTGNEVNTNCSTD